MAKETKDITLEKLVSGAVKPEDVAALPFEEALKLLEELVNSVESGTLPLERSMTSYERGVLLVDHLRGLLSGAEEKLKLLQKS